MKLNIVNALMEMGKPAQVCPKCGHGPLSKTHSYYRQGVGWVGCKNSPAPGYPLASGSATSSPASAPAASTPPAPTAPAASPAAPKAAAPATPTQAAAPAAPKTVVHTPTAQRVTPPSAGDRKTRVKMWLDEHEVENYTINDDNSVDVEGDVHLVDSDYEGLVKFGTVSGDFIIGAGNIRSLKNAPKHVGGDLSVTGLDITTLAGLPESVDGDVTLAHLDDISSLEGMPKRIGGSLTLAKFPKLTSIGNIQDIVEEVNGTVDVHDMPVLKRGLVAIMLIPGVTGVKTPNAKVSEIMERHIKGDSDFYSCQEDLIQSGFDAAAALD